MPNTTADNLTRKQIRALRDEAAAHGDTELLADCEIALSEPDDAGYAEAIEHIVAAINDAATARDVEPDSERTQRADYQHDADRDWELTHGEKS